MGWRAKCDQRTFANQQLEDQIMRYRLMERDVTNPLALGLLQHSKQSRPQGPATTCILDGLSG
jgi:hypothetical protein